LQVGCGPNALSGWLNADIISGNIYLDAKRKMPFKSNIFDFIFCEHFIEHLTRENGLKFLNECYRILKPDGVLRITSPDLEKIMDLYYDRNKYVKRQELIAQYGKGAEFQPCELFNDYMHNWGHKFIYDKRTIEQALSNIGFIYVVFCDCKKSSYLELSGLERHLEKYSFLNPAETFVVEARK
jgi:predicted SAM-dependent methyltransferase